MEKVSLPIKTKIAACCMSIIGGIGILYGIARYIKHGRPVTPGFVGMSDAHLGVVFWGLIFLICSLLLFKKRKYGWVFSMILNGWLVLQGSFGFFVSLFEGDVLEFLQWGFPLFFISLFLFILLLLDRKNFWKIAS